VTDSSTSAEAAGATEPHRSATPIGPATPVGPATPREPTEPTGPDAREAKPGLVRRVAVDAVIAVALAAALALQFGALKTLRITSINMVPTLVPDDHVVVRGFDVEPARGEVVVYRSPFSDEGVLIARVVAVEGDHIEMTEDGLLLDDRTVAAAADCDERPHAGATDSADAERHAGMRNAGDQACAAPQPCRGQAARDCLLAAETLGGHRYVTRKAGSFSTLLFPRRIVPEDHVFVLNDNRIDERDSRIYGAIPRTAIVGVASFVYYAFDETGIRWDRMSRRVS
jgi:signal peptidase I